MTVEIRNGKKVEATGETVQEALWELKRNRPGDLLYPVQADLGSSVITGVHVRLGDDEMKVIEMDVVEVGA